MWRVILALWALVLPYAAAQELAAGSLLVANENLGDPNFSRTVVLIVQYDDDNGTVGLILNRPSSVPLSKLFPNVKGAKEDPVYLGGPVDASVAQALVRLSAKSSGAVKLFGNVYVTADKALVEKSVASGTEPSKFRVYVGYAGWAPAQLEMEIALGAWTVVRGRTGPVFDPHPDSLWLRLNRESETSVALAQRHIADHQAAAGSTGALRPLVFALAPLTSSRR